MEPYAPPDLFSNDKFSDIQYNVRTRDEFPAGVVLDEVNINQPQGPDLTDPCEMDLLDLSLKIPGMYRVLDLISEQGSGGLVDKILIAQKGLQRLVNDLRPGAYASLTKVDFKALDELSLRPVGVYGDKGDLVRFLSSLGVLNEDMSAVLIHSLDDGNTPNLRSGIYVVRPFSPSDIVYAVYWPQDSTWLDNASTTQRRNRVTFMRYLTKISEQIICLMSPAQTRNFVWDYQEHSDDGTCDLEGEFGDDDRLFTFEVARTNEQEEDIISRPGFSISSKLMLDPPETQRRSLPLPRLISGEVAQGFLSTRLIPPSAITRQNERFMNDIQLRQFITTSGLKIRCDLQEAELVALAKAGMQDIYPDAWQGWLKRKEDILGELELLEQSETKGYSELHKQTELDFGREAYGYLVTLVLEQFPSLNALELFGDEKIAFEELQKLREGFDSFLSSCRTHHHHLPALHEFKKAIGKINSEEFREQKKRIVCVQIIRKDDTDRKHDDLVKRVIAQGIPSETVETPKQEKGGIFSSLLSIWPSFTSGPIQSIPAPVDAKKIKAMVNEHHRGLSDVQFIKDIPNYLRDEPLIEPATRAALRDAHHFFAKHISKAFGSLMPQCFSARDRLCQIQIGKTVANKKASALKDSLQLLVSQIETSQTESNRNFTMINFRMRAPSYSWQKMEYIVTGVDEVVTPEYLEYQINKLNISSEEQDRLRLDHSFIPSPSTVQKDSVKFHLSPQHCIVHAQLLSHDRLLLVVDDKRDNFLIYLEPLHAINAAIANQGAKRKLNQSKIGKDILVAYNEDKRILVLCSASKITLHVMVFDEVFSHLQPWGNPFELGSWYTGEAVCACHMTFVTGTEEVLLVDSGSQARIFSLVSQRFRPATLSLPQMPLCSLSSPDGACALFLFQLRDKVLLTAHHWDSFGAPGGITLELNETTLGIHFVVTSFINRRSIHLTFLDHQQGQCRSFALDITKKSSELMFREKGARMSHDNSRKDHHLNNCIIDCFSDVWFRFPVVPAISRDTINGAASRRCRTVSFISENTGCPFASYFKDMIRLFEDQTKKPTGDCLESIHIGTQTFKGLFSNMKSATWPDGISCFNAGQWLADLLCLIPIQIAVTRENRFVPLKNGVTSAEFERSLLGAEVGRIVDSLSFGWYESILSSYMADKPVRVVSSMGEQSVGKSFALNHLVDTSFAGSAMRTTEGVWMSITPTEDALLVALDFEGVHSIERSPQEDALLVLFNTAMSNLVLFRNNFALSRDIANLFQSFQASSVILDPAANPSLFQSTLVIIIKDVVESDKREVVREFSLKFQKIVSEEQTANFITRLHAGRLDIIPWPVIESDKFYTYFSTLKRRLYSQAITHPSAGEFLHTLKILMAKLKANDWGAMSQSLASHRAQTLLTILPTAMEYGKTTIHPDFEPLKNMDNGTVIDHKDYGHRLFTSTSSVQGKERETLLFELEKTWEGYGERHRMDDATWSSQLANYLLDIVNVRISQVEAWVSANLNRFKTTNTSVDALQREVANATIDLRANVEICRMTCSDCHLLCTLSRRHDPLQPHDCHTNHRCAHACEFADEHLDESKACHSRAGHDGPHICHVEDHLCGQPCMNQDKKGCQGACTQMVGHSGSHICSARKHSCGKPCQLTVFSPRKTLRYSCPGTCSYPSDEEHVEHACDNRECPITCDLCKRLCTNTHLHGLDPLAGHLCGDVHRCNALCASGICEIDTAPQSIDATFTGRHETFQYTKYTQVAKKLPCVKPIPVGQHAHIGEHIHSLEPSPFHFCDVRCRNCGYYCTLPRGHPQQEHETSHGSMSRTKWAIDGPEDSVMEVDGRKFAADDEGAPMMCNLVCQSLNRHAHIDLCRTVNSREQGCRGSEHQHITTRLAPNPEHPKDWISHALHWRRSGFRDPYSKEDQANFSKCDVMCPGPEHTATQPVQPSYCTLPLFHAPHTNDQLTGLGWVSSDGHMFSCKNPVVMQQAFHVIFVIDRSGSMGSSNRISLPATPVTQRISSQHNNRLGAVYLSLHAFWDSRQVALASSPTSQSPPARRDAYSVLLFNGSVTCCFENDFQQTADQLLEQLLPNKAHGGTNYTAAIRETEAVMKRNWSGERSPVIIFLSDGECAIADGTVENLCRASIALGKPLSFHTVSFGPGNQVLRRMAQIARDVERAGPRDPLLPATAHAESSYAEALDSVRLAETFLGLADSLKKTRGALMS